ncbi:UNVERIFIED_CONTAM: hypothetical protein Scaly_2244300 [Sesamum calycinum]|uniref:ATP-dependent DNA helicase n=1 Tax=Sesamum calycinum TaxID=2727403 RepID=A0AAW2MA67_9LAMI
MSRIYPSVVRLQIHLPNMQQVQFYSHQSISDVLANERNSQTMLTEFFKIYIEEQEQNIYPYKNFSKYYRWLPSERKWLKRSRTQKVIGRVYAVAPSEDERFYLRLLLNHVTGPKSFDDLLTVDGVRYLTFKQAAEKHGLFEDDNSIRECLVEARSFRMPSALRRLFAIILLYCERSGVRMLWEENYPHMIEDYPSSRNVNSLYITNKLLHDINDILQQHKRSIKEFDLPQISEGFEDMRAISGVIEHELSIPISDDDLYGSRVLNAGQLLAFDIISQAIRQKHSAIFFVDGPSGTGKTFLYRTLLASFRNDGCIILATATSGIAANLLTGGRTAHSKFKIPIKFEPMAMCRFSKLLCALINQASTIIWDEAPMANIKAFEIVDHTFRDMLGVDLPFGGKVMILGGDFRQVLPVVINGTKSQIIKASIVESSLWSSVKVLNLSKNMRA